MTDEELVAHALGFMSGNGICGRKELERADRGSYDALLRLKKKSPGMMGRAFPDVGASGHKEAADGVNGALESFGAQDEA